MCVYIYIHLYTHIHICIHLLYNIYIFNIRFSTKNIKFVNTYIITFSTNQLENPIKYIDLNIIEISFFLWHTFHSSTIKKKSSPFFKCKWEETFFVAFININFSLNNYIVFEVPKLCPQLRLYCSRAKCSVTRIYLRCNAECVLTPC